MENRTKEKKNKKRWKATLIDSPLRRMPETYITQAHANQAKSFTLACPSVASLDPASVPMMKLELG